MLFSILIIAASLNWALPLATACVQQYPATVARELGEVSTHGQEHPLRTPPAGARPMAKAGRPPGVDAGGAAETEGNH
jgi:hypothetical protein